jgi:predicted acylesterase/phospholipase RssA
MIAVNSDIHAVVLSGGGAYAAYEIGIMKALCAGLSPATAFKPLNIGIATGTSAGAYNASFLVSQGAISSIDAVNNLEAIWLARLAGDPEGCSNGVARYRLDPFALFNPVCLMRDPAKSLRDFTEDVNFLTQGFADRAAWFLNASGPIEERLTRLVDLSMLFAENLGTLIPETICFENIPTSPVQLRIAVTNWSTGDLEIYANAEVIHPLGPLYVQASAATPGIFPPLRIGDCVYVDGGVLMNTPLKPAIGAGAGTLHVIYLDPDVAKIPIDRLKNTLDTMERIWAIQNAQSLNTDIETAARVNRGLQTLRSSRLHSHSDAELASLIHFLGHQGASSLSSELEESEVVQSYNQVTIHRYHPDDDLGGFFGLLRFDRPTIEQLIQRGYDDAVHHDCALEGCIGSDGKTLTCQKVREASARY